MDKHNRKIWHLGTLSNQDAENFKQLLPSWNIQPVKPPITEPVTLSNNQASVGIVRLAANTASATTEDIAEFIRHNVHIPWVALVDKECLNDPPSRQLIANLAFDYHTLPADKARLRYSIGHAQGMARLRRDKSHTTGAYSTTTMIGSSDSIQSVKSMIKRAACADAPVLITGESGTGKELVARELHQQSSRRRGPFVAVNCGAIPHNLIQSELFGHEKGAFTNATEMRVGKVESAHTGTLFLDEIGELPLNQQVNFLRFLQDGVIQRVGGRKNILVDIRIVAATNVDLVEAIQQQGFREDLYYRINVLNVHMPPLRERDQDPVELAEHFLAEFRVRQDRNLHFSPRALKAIHRHNWPGNIRELKNRIFKAVMMSTGCELSDEDLGLENNDNHKHTLTLFKARELAEADIIKASLDYTQNNISEASRLLQVSRPTLYKLIARHNLSPKNSSTESLRSRF
ncbi:sigma-54 dependent transcriptional regulator [Aestuariicella sp. G3-2]|uniref:sigma-54 dependent transcriptional regulator n=1 Tax=Pseudomaricurvus albidus TaxID=2842452 RepID=UPI001C0AACC2|nr:sigma-54 dependent transcriptional regulator [Aestuariicella albida]MBU3068975.1 sigma-54 dependent transcriptional regulator [Aestuariicella albida]